MSFQFQNKIHRYNSNQFLNTIKSQGSIVFTNGCFDLIHPGHIHYLYNAKKLGDFLIIGLNSDKSISKIKGKNRPINDFEFRSKILAGFNFVDLIIEFIEETPINLIKKISPNILVKGKDYLENEIVGSDYVKSKGGVIHNLDFLRGYSSTKIINRIKK